MRRVAGALAAAIALALSAEPAYAHLASASIGSFYAGMLHPLTAPVHVLPMLALGLMAGQRRLSDGYAVVLVFPGAMAVGAISVFLLPALQVVSALNLASTVLLGVIVALALPIPLWLLYTLATIFGLTHGYANGLAITAEHSPFAFITGMAIAALLVVGHSLNAAVQLLRLRVAWLPIAVRVAGSWIAAIGILVTGFSLR